MQQETRILLVVALMAALLTFTGGHNRTAVTSTPSSLNKNVTVTVTPSPTIAPSDSAINDPVLDDDLATRKDDDDTTIKAEEKTDEPSNRAKPRKKHTFFKFFVLCFFCYGIWRVFFSSDQFRFRSQYTNLDAANIARETYLSV